ncbi:hypothetical protein DSO57_1019509 [Entomophthora muscae]|uniref:Uncharacterized protein n=1 Tax=Entomophthora muscae TaxID=34485 RepID=A0ACC2TER8_9FUNG|nr:hypothetical protein DSO57_1019509 [Entomophthora muscae]
MLPTRLTLLTPSSPMLPTRLTLNKQPNFCLDNISPACKTTKHVDHHTNSWRDYEVGQDVPAGLVIYNNILVPINQYNTLKARRLLPTTPTTTAPPQPEIPNIMFQRLHTAEIGAFTGLCRKNATLWINSTQSKFEQVDYPQRLWVSEIALCVTGTASCFVTKWLAQHPDQKENWEMFKAAFLKKFFMKDLDVVIMTKLQTFKMIGTIKEYIVAYEGLHNQAPNTINFDEPGLA